MFLIYLKYPFFAREISRIFTHICQFFAVYLLMFLWEFRFLTQKATLYAVCSLMIP
jgi:hypothetical protein